jgi:hypothetical protein
MNRGIRAVYGSQGAVDLLRLDLGPHLHVGAAAGVHGNQSVGNPQGVCQMTVQPLIYRKKVVLKKFGMSETTLRRWMKDEAFPRPR